jgi:hypothetical protein
VAKHRAGKAGRQGWSEREFAVGNFFERLASELSKLAELMVFGLRQHGDENGWQKAVYILRLNWLLPQFVPVNLDLAK